MKFRTPKSNPESRESVPAAAPSQIPGGLAEVMRTPITLSTVRATALDDALNDGLGFYRHTNEERLRQAVDAFDEDMQKALFEVLFLLHVNDPALANVTYTAIREEKVGGVLQMVETEQTADLYVPNAPHGVKGLGAMPHWFLEPYEGHIHRTFGRSANTGHDGSQPIVLVQSIGSIGTIGHKSGASDLDLQVIYDLVPSGLEAMEWDDDTFRLALYMEQSWWTDQIEARLEADAKAGKPRPATVNPKQMAERQIAKRFPQLTRYFEHIDAGRPVIPGEKGAGVEQAPLLYELMGMVQRHLRRNRAGEIADNEGLLNRKIEGIQNYITDKYPSAEIYLFNYSLDTFRAGKYLSSLDFKESSGSAYELILNYDTLLPGIQFTGALPSHFIFSDETNNDPGVYQRVMDAIAFDKLVLYRDVASVLVDLGPAPDLDLGYVTRHGGAIYWEAFKASSGNLPKATLNLLRFEMLLDPRLNKTIIQLVKSPGLLDGFIRQASGGSKAEQQALAAEDHGLPPWYLQHMEFDHPPLKRDPWWLRFKALKIAFAEDDGVEGLAPNERGEISLLMDLAFALHVRISDVMTKPGRRKTFEGHREKVLVQFLDNAFPAGTEKRSFLSHIFAGDVRAVNRFESLLRQQFRTSLARVQIKIAEEDWEALRRKNQEVRLWHHYYEDNFERPPGMVPMTIMKHLMVPRGRLRLGFHKGKSGNGGGWTFESLQKGSAFGKRFDTFGVLEHMPETVTLVEQVGFLRGLAECILNGYYGILNRGTLKESRTAVEFDRAHMDPGIHQDKQVAFLRPDHIDGIMERILDFFPKEPHHYMDFFRKDRRLTRVMVFLNLWRFGRLSILARDNLNVFFCEEFDHPELEEDIAGLHKNPDGLLNAEPLHETMDRYLRERRLYVDEVELECWINPLSVTTEQTSVQEGVKEEELAKAFREVLLRSMPRLDDERKPSM